MRAATFLALTAMAAAAPVWARPSVEVTTCGQQVPNGTVGYLTADLDCTGFAGAPGAVLLGANAAFDLRGFTLTTDTIFGIYCGGVQPENGGLNPCTVSGGTITGAMSGHGIIAKRVRASHLTISGPVVNGIAANGPFRGGDVHVSGCGATGIQADTSVRLVDSTVTGNGEASVANGKGRIRLIGSSVVDNGTDPDCGQAGKQCADVFSRTAPKLVDSTCGTSGGNPVSQGDAHDWNVCALD
jgi:hypothetical protein